MKRKLEPNNESSTIKKFFKASTNDLDISDKNTNGIVKKLSNADCVVNRCLKIRLSGTKADNSIKSRVERRFCTSDLRSDNVCGETRVEEESNEKIVFKKPLTRMDLCNDSGVDESKQNSSDDQCLTDGSRLYSDISDNDLKSSTESLNSNTSSLYSDISDDVGVMRNKKPEESNDKQCVWSSVSSECLQEMKVGIDKMQQLTVETDEHNRSGSNSDLSHEASGQEKSPAKSYEKCKIYGEKVSDKLDTEVKENDPVQGSSRYASSDYVNSSLFNSSQESIEDTDSEGEDLVNFNSDLFSRTKPHVVTPKKSSLSFHGSPLSSPLPNVSKVEVKEKSYKFDIEKILQHNSKIEKKTGCPLQKIDDELEDAISKGGIATIIDDAENSQDTDDENILPHHEHKLEKYMLSPDEDEINDALPGENVLCNLPHHNKSFTIQPLSMNSRSLRGIERQMTSPNVAELRELLCGKWILNYYLVYPCPDEVGEWLFGIMCRHPDVHIVNACFQSLWALLEVGSKGKRERGIRSWILDLRSFLNIFIELGATLQSLFPGETDSLVRELIPVKDSGSLDDDTETSAPSPVSSTPSLYTLMNITKIIQLTIHCLNLHSSRYCLKDLKCLLMVLTRLSLDLRLQDCWFDIQMCLAAVLNSYGESQWNDEVKELCQLLSKVTNNHCNQHHVVSILPYTERGIYLRRSLGLHFLQTLVPQFVSGSEDEDKQMAYLNEKKSDEETFETIKVCSLVPLIKQLQPTNQSSYNLLHSIIGILDITIGNEPLKPSDKNSLDNLLKVLRTLNGNIRDPRAAFMNRTKVKNLLVRTINKLLFMSQCISSSQRSLKHFFDHQHEKVISDAELLTESPMKLHITDDGSDHDTEKAQENDMECEDDDTSNNGTSNTSKKLDLCSDDGTYSDTVKKSLFQRDSDSSEES